MTNKEKIKELSDSINSDKNLLIRLINEKSNTSPLRDTDNTVELIDFGGGDMNHAMSAWTSTSRDLNDEKIGRIGSLLELLAQNGHGTPFEKSYVQFLVKCDIASHIHILKHRIGVSVNGQSARYKEFTSDRFYLPSDWPIGEQTLLEKHIKDCFEKYHSAVDILVSRGYTRSRAKESARFYLPYGIQLYTDVSFNLRSFAHFINLRMDIHAQAEIRDIATKMLVLASNIPAFELSLKALLPEKIGDLDYEK